MTPVLKTLKTVNGATPGSGIPWSDILAQDTLALGGLAAWDDVLRGGRNAAWFWDPIIGAVS